jgi:hypothetical protein
MFEKAKLAARRGRKATGLKKRDNRVAWKKAARLFAYTVLRLEEMGG